MALLVKMGVPAFAEGGWSQPWSSASAAAHIPPWKRGAGTAPPSGKRLTGAAIGVPFSTLLGTRGADTRASGLTLSRLPPQGVQGRALPPAMPRKKDSSPHEWKHHKTLLRSMGVGA